MFASKTGPRAPKPPRAALMRDCLARWQSRESVITLPPYLSAGPANDYREKRAEAVKWMADNGVFSLADVEPKAGARS